MEHHDSFDALVERLRAGDEAAARQVFQRFVGRLIGLARGRLEKVLAGKEDPEDVLQSVFLSFFVRARDGQVTADDWDDVWSLLAVITLRKCGNRIAYYRAGRRDVGQEVRLRHAEDSSGGWEALVRDPTPSEVAVLTETLEALLRDLDERAREMVMLYLQGYTMQEISTRVGWAQRTVRRTIELVRKRLQRMQAADAEPA